MAFYSKSLAEMLATVPRQQAAPALTARNQARYERIVQWADAPPVAPPKRDWAPYRADRPSSPGDRVNLPAEPKTGLIGPAPSLEDMPRPLQREESEPTEAHPLIRAPEVTAREIVAAYLRGNTPNAQDHKGGRTAWEVSRARLAALEKSKWLEGHPAAGYFGPSLAKWSR